MHKDFQPNELMQKIPTGQASQTLTEGCLVLEGGAFRGLYSQGVMDALMQCDINFSCVIGVSAGAMGGLNYASGQIGRSARVNLGYRHYSDYVGGKALLHAHSPIRLDFALEDYNAIEPLNETYFNDPRRRFVAVATGCETGETLYFEKGKCGDIIAAVKASASMPFVSPMVNVDGIPCLDGGCSCRIPYKWAIDQGYKKIVIIRTRDRTYRKPIHEKKHSLRLYRSYPAFEAVLERDEEDYNRQCSEIEELEKAGRVFVLSPSQPVTVGRIESDVGKLSELYWLGYYDTIRNLYALRAYLA